MREMFLPTLLFVVGIVILLSAANEFITQSSLYSARFRLSPLIVGTTIVAIGTSFPELVVSVIAVLQGDAGMALGNIVGSNIVNILLILGLAFILGKIRIGTAKTQKNIWVMVSVSLVFMLMHWTLIPLIPGIVMLFFFVAFTIMEIDWGIRGRIREDLFRVKRMFARPRPANGWLFLISLLGVISGGYITVSSAELLSAMLGLSTTVFGLSVTAITTSLPELIVTLISENKGQDKIALGNIIGSNIYNLSLIGGLLLLFPGQINLHPLIWVYFFGTALLALFIVTGFSGRVVPRWVGLGLLCLLLGYFRLMVSI